MLTLPRPGQKYHFKGNLELEIQNIWNTLQHIHIKNWRFFSHEDGLYIQQWSSANRKWESKVLIKSTGAVDAEGAVTGSVSLPDVGN